MEVVALTHHWWHSSESKMWNGINTKCSSMTFYVREIWQTENKGQPTKMKRNQQNVWFWIIFLLWKSKKTTEKRMFTQANSPSWKGWRFNVRWELCRLKSNQLKSKWISFSTKCISFFAWHTQKSESKHTKFTNWMEKWKNTYSHILVSWLIFRIMSNYVFENQFKMQVNVLCVWIVPIFELREKNDCRFTGWVSGVYLWKTLRS